MMAVGNVDSKGMVMVVRYGDGGEGMVVVVVRVW